MDNILKGIIIQEKVVLYGLLLTIPHVDLTTEEHQMLSALDRDSQVIYHLGMLEGRKKHMEKR